MRIALAKLLLQKPSLLLLDEPTNHLDLESRNWLEQYLHDYPNAFILISHDRYFLDVTVNKTIEIWNKRMHVYHGNYEKYVQQKEERRTQLMNAYKNQRERIEALEAFINRFRHQATWPRRPASLSSKKIEHQVPEEESTGPSIRPNLAIEAQNLTHLPPTEDVLDNLSFHHRARRSHRPRRANGAGNRHSSACSALSGLSATAGALVDFAQYQHRSSIPTRSCSTTSPAPLQSQSPSFALASRMKQPFGKASRRALRKECNHVSVSPLYEYVSARRPQRTISTSAPRTLLDAIRNHRHRLFVSHDRYFIDGPPAFEVEDGGPHLPWQLRGLSLAQAGRPRKSKSLTHR
jgi:ATP-binding cassette subfamily F protein 3